MKEWEQVKTCQLCILKKEEISIYIGNSMWAKESSIQAIGKLLMITLITAHNCCEKEKRKKYIYSAILKSQTNKETTDENKKRTNQENAYKQWKTTIKTKKIREKGVYMTPIKEMPKTQEESCKIMCNKQKNNER